MEDGPEWPQRSEIVPRGILSFTFVYGNCALLGALRHEASLSCATYTLCGEGLVMLRSGA